VGSLLLGVDLGTTATKATLLDAEAGVLAAASEESPLASPAAGWAEASTDRWWRNVCRLVPRVAEAAGVHPREIAGVACSGMVPAVVVLGEAGSALRPAILQNDARAAVEIAEVAAALEAVGFDALARTGSVVSQQSVAPTWRWLVRHEPEVAGAARRLVGSYDWLAIALGAPAHVEENWALESGLFTLEGSPAAPVLEAAGLDPSLLAPVRRPADPVGEVGREAAAATSLAAGTAIYVGGADHVLAAFAAGLAEAGDWLVKLGGAGDILVVSDEPVVDRRWYLDAHPLRGRWLPNGCMATSGSLLRWAQQLFGGVGLAELDREASQAEPAPLICLPYLLGEKSPLHDPDLRGAFVGLHLGHGRGELFRACLEAVAFGFRQHVECFEARQVALGQARVSNGGSASSLWKQILADVLGTELVPILDHGGAALGAALVAAIGAGALGADDASRRFVSLGEPIAPQSCPAYEEAYAVFLELQALLTPVSHRLARRGRT